MIKTALTITAFVAVMMLLIEYVNVYTGGAWQSGLARRRWGQCVLGALLGVTPGCLGAFAVVTMYSHGALTLGAVVAAMIATSGDEAFVMLALIPKQGAAIMGVLLVVGIGVGALVDAVTGSRHTEKAAGCLELHAVELGGWFAPRRIVSQWKECSAARGTMAIALGLFGGAILTGQIGPEGWTWMRASLLAVAGMALFVVGTVPDHFLEEHLWRHVVKRHAPRVLLWTLGALAGMHVITEVLQVGGTAHGGRWALLAAACLIGLIPESGPHLIFVTLYAEGVAPVSILMASSIVQDGHGMLPMLAHSRREFALVKAINFCAGLGAGAAGLAIGL